MEDVQRSCTECGHELQSVDHFCPECGHKADEVELELHAARPNATATATAPNLNSRSEIMMPPEWQSL